MADSFSIGNKVYFIPGDSDKAGNWPMIMRPGGFPGTLGVAMARETEAAQSNRDVTGNLRINPANWARMMNDPALQATGRARIEDRRQYDPTRNEYFPSDYEPPSDVPLPTSDPRRRQMPTLKELSGLLRIGNKTYGE